jgi:hypothetical protein
MIISHMWFFLQRSIYHTMVAASFWGIVLRQWWSVAVVFLVIEKYCSQVFLLSLTPLMRPYIVKMTWSRPKMPCPQRILFLFSS